jgi:hypothetical protein
MRTIAAHAFAGVVTILTSGNVAQGARWDDASRAQVFAHCVVSKADSEDTTEHIDKVASACSCVVSRVTKGMSIGDFASMGSDESDPHVAVFFKINEECEAEAGL